MNTKPSEPEKSSHTDDTIRQTSSSPQPAESSQNERGPRALPHRDGFLRCCACPGHCRTLCHGPPLEKELLSRDVSSIAQEIDSVVKFRSTVIGIGAGIVEVDTLLNRRLDRFMAALREHLPDFLSLEIINERGKSWP